MAEIVSLAEASLRPDVTVIHAQRADRVGNVQYWGITGVQKEAVLAAARSVVIVEEIVDVLSLCSRRCNRGRESPTSRRGRAGTCRYPRTWSRSRLRAQPS